MTEYEYLNAGSPLRILRELPRDQLGTIAAIWRLRLFIASLGPNPLSLYDKVGPEKYSIALLNQQDRSSFVDACNIAESIPRGPDRSLAAHKLRDVLGNPFRKPGFVPERFRIPLVDGLATAAFDDHLKINGEIDPVILFLLADALEDAGVSGTSRVVRHLRGWITCYRCGGTGKVRSPGGHGDYDDVLCSTCNPDGPERDRGFSGPNFGWVRSTLPHIKGCWAVDACLRREL